MVCVLLSAGAGDEYPYKKVDAQKPCLVWGVLEKEQR